MSACAMSAWMSEKPIARSGFSARIASTLALVKADTRGFSRRARAGRTVNPEMPTMRASSPSAYSTSVGSSVRQTIRVGNKGEGELHVPAIATAHLEERMRDLAERADAHRVHQHLEHVGVGDHGLPQALEHRRRPRGVARVEIGEALQLALLLVLGGPGQLD